MANNETNYNVCPVCGANITDVDVCPQCGWFRLTLSSDAPPKIKELAQKHEDIIKKRHNELVELRRRAESAEKEYNATKQELENANKNLRDANSNLSKQAHEISSLKDENSSLKQTRDKLQADLESLRQKPSIPKDALVLRFRKNDDNSYTLFDDSKTLRTKSNNPIADKGRVLYLSESFGIGDARSEIAIKIIIPKDIQY